MDEIMGTIKIFAFNFAPKQWALCNGQLLSISQNSALFSLLGTMYGGDGVSTFALPDLRGRSMIGIGQGNGLSFITQGQKAGTENVTLNTTTMPGHMHPIVAGTAVATCAAKALAGGTISNECDNGGNSFSTGGATANIYSEPNVNYAKIGGVTNTISGSTSAIGSNVPFDIRNPYVGINHCILLYGVFPSRN
ncbi:phage tail protein [Flavobacterium sp. N2038]|uniref:phage tail protein n=1 Tax=Flavobacterium sp. N2038 TaxID=2986829 RepID=UPI002224B9CD|nr:tail fiber protein [Flavobacterium sp. N2038]